LLLIFGDDIERSWKQISNFNSGEEHSKPAKAAQPAPVSMAMAQADPGFAMDLGEQVVIRDERGVRLAREVETSD
jgi:cyanophycin synthetase